MDIEKLIIELAKAGAKELAPFPINTILIWTIEDITKQEKMLSTFEQMLERHVKNMERNLITPFKEGKVYLEEAGNALNQEEQKQFIRTARERFVVISQLDLPEYPLLPIKARFYIGVCYDLLSDGQNALRWYLKAHDLAVKTIVAQDPRIRQVDKKWRTFSREAQRELAELDAQHVRFEYSIIFAVPKNHETRTDAVEGIQKYRQQKIAALGSMDDWPMGEPATRQMFSFASHLNDLIASRILHR